MAFLLCGLVAHGAELRNEWTDSDTGHRLVRLSRIPGDSESFYFHQNAFTAEGDKMVFANYPQGTNRSRDFMVLDWRTRGIQPLTSGGTNRGEVVSAKGRRLYYMRDGAIYAANLDTRQARLIAQLPRGWRGLTVNADETLLAGAYGEGAMEISRGQPRSYWFSAIHDAKLPHVLFTVEIATGKTNIIHRGNDWFNHVQFSPTDPSLLMFCHEGPWHKVDRIWNIRSDGSGLRLVHARTMENEIAGHEFWAADGKRVWFDLQMPRGERFFIAGVEVEKLQQSTFNTHSSSNNQPSTSNLTSKSGGRIESAGDAKSEGHSEVAAAGDGRAPSIKYAVKRNEWSVHFNVSRDGKLFAGDGGAPNMVAHADDGKWIYLFTPEPGGTVKSERLVNMAKHDYALEPNVNFTPDGKWIVFRANFDGSSQVYAVEVSKAKGGT